jgi:DNA polymerase III delta prime subunit
MPVPLDIRSSLSREKRDEATYWNRLSMPLPLGGGQITPDSIHHDLTAEFPWMNAAIDRICDDLRLHHLRAGPRWFKFRPMLLVGQPGIGKSRFARRLAELVGLSLRTINLGGSSDSRDIAGTSKGWGTATPSAIVRSVRESEMANPLILVDEVEKASASSHNGRVIDVLLTLLEPEGARHWHDECLCRNIDLRQVNWILSANSSENLPAPLLSRLAVIKVEKPPTTAFPSILAGIMSDLSHELGIDVNDLPPLFPEAAAYLERRFRHGTSIRVLQASVRRALAATLSPSSSRH